MTSANGVLHALYTNGRSCAIRRRNNVLGNPEVRKPCQFPVCAKVKRLYRIRENERFQEIRRKGQSYSNRLLVLCVLPNGLPYSRFGFSVSRRIGKAVVRNRVKRRIREAVRLRMGQVESGWDLVFIARNPIGSADFHEIDAAGARLLRRASLLREANAAECQE